MRIERKGDDLPKARRVAIIYHYLAHYREAVFACLSRPDARHHYEIFADQRSNIATMATIDPAHSNSVHRDGRLNWRFIRNLWLTSNVLWQTGAVRVALRSDHEVIILLGNMYFLSTWVAACIGRLRGKRVLMWTHGVLREERGLRGAIRRSFYKLAHGLLLYGDRARTILAAQGFDARRLYVVYNSLDTETQLRVLENLPADATMAVRRDIGIARDTPFLISIGRMTGGKDLDLLPRALAEMNAAGRRVELVFVGGGPARAEIEQLVAQLALEGQVHFLGEIYAEEALGPLIAAADICISPGPVGLTAMHALIYGTPVITHDAPDQQKPEYEVIVPGINGAYFRRGDAHDLAVAIQTWLSADRNREHLASICRETLLKHYTPEAQRDAIDRAVDGLPARDSITAMAVGGARAAGSDAFGS